MVYSPGKYVGIKLYAVYSSSVQCIDAGNNCEEKQYLVYSLGKDKEGYRFQIASKEKKIEYREKMKVVSYEQRQTLSLYTIIKN